MMEKSWTEVDAYMGERLLPPDPVLDAALRTNASAGLRPIDVAPLQGKFLQLLARSVGARRILEVGTLGGYSTIWLARALPDGGKLVTLERDPVHAGVARQNIDRAGLLHLVDIRIGAAIDTLPQLALETDEPFDFVFIDADKQGNVAYLDWAVRLGKPGTVIVLDNVVRGGRVVDSASIEPNVKGSRAAFDYLSAHPRLEATALQTVGAKGWDGFIVAVMN